MTTTDAWDALTALLTDHPEAWVGAMGSDALLFREPPTGGPFSGHRVLQGRWVLDHAISADRPALSAAWRAAHTEGTSTVTVRVVGGGTATFDFFDVMASCGSYIVVGLVHDGAELAVADFESHALRPRHCRVLREESGRIFEVDDDAELVLGWSRDQLTGALPLELFHPDDHERVIDGWMATLADTSNGQRFRARFQRPDDTWMWLELTAFNRLDEEPSRVECEMLDVSDEMAAHEAVRAREQLLHRLAEALPIGVLQVDRARQVVYRNDHLTTLLGHPDATSCDEQFAATRDEDRDAVLAAITSGLDEGLDCDVVIHVAPGDIERVVRVITKALVAESGDTTGVIVSVTDVTEETHASRELERRATFDALTGCLNRASILGRLQSSLDDVHGTDGTAVIFLDLDGFKAINDRCGHSVGDDVLQLVSDRLRTATRGNDDVGRLGGDEFLIVCSDVTEEEAMIVARRICDLIGREPTVAGLDAPLRASVGVAWSAGGQAAVGETLVARADEAMYRSKRAGSGQPELWAA